MGRYEPPPPSTKELHALTKEIGVCNQVNIRVGGYFLHNVNNMPRLKLIHQTITKYKVAYGVNVAKMIRSVLQVWKNFYWVRLTRSKFWWNQVRLGSRMTLTFGRIEPAKSFSSSIVIKVNKIGVIKETLEAILFKASVTLCYFSNALTKYVLKIWASSNLGWFS